jgi:uroporphyrinogen-III synthase
MLDILAVPLPKNLSAEELLELFTAGLSGKRSVNFRLSKEGRRILDEEARRFKTDRTKALEIMLREIREIRKGGGR